MKGKHRLTYSGEIEKNEMIKDIMKRHVFSYSWVLEQLFFVLFLRKRLLDFYVICCFRKFVHVICSHSTKSLRSSRSQMFFKIGVLKNFSILARKYLCWSLFWKKLHAWRATSKTWTRTLDLDPEKPGLWKAGSWITWTLKNLDSKTLSFEKPGPWNGKQKND